MLNGSRVWGITSYFNPCKYSSRYRNYQVFRRHLGIPLVAVEQSFDGTFELGDGDADIVVRIAEGSVMWQKERLLNAGRRALPDSCSAVVLLDADVVLDGDAWVEPTLALLRDRAMVQPFSHAYRLPPGTPATELPGLDESLRAYGMAYVRAGDQALDHSTGSRWPVMGGAWAVRRSLLDEHGIYDGCIIGGGDQAIGYAVYGEFRKASVPLRMDAARESHYLRWAEPFHAAARGSTGYVPGRIGILWHGETHDRRYLERHDGLASFGFDPFADIALTPGGAWEWSSDKPAMHRYVREYFAGRHEDPAAAHKGV